MQPLPERSRSGALGIERLRGTSPGGAPRFLDECQNFPLGVLGHDHHTALLMILTVATVGCHAPQLRPAPTADTQGPAARRDVAETSGVRLSANMQWAGWPSDLQDVLTPAEVTIENFSGSSILVVPTDFALSSPAGEVWPALEPSDALRITAEFEGAKSPWYLHDRSSFFIPAAPPPGPNPPPTDPELLPAGGMTTARLFFGVPTRRLDRVDLVARVVTASGRSLGEVRLAFVRSR